MNWREPWFSTMLRDRRACVGLVTAAAVIAGAHIAGFSLWRCPFHSVTGLPCPGCGLTRGITALLSGRLSDSLSFNPFSPIFLLAWLALLLAAVLPAAGRDALAAGMERVEKSTGLPTLILIVFLGYGLTRLAITCSHSGEIPWLPHGSSTQTLNTERRTP